MCALKPAKEHKSIEKFMYTKDGIYIGYYFRNIVLIYIYSIYKRIERK